MNIKPRRKRRKRKAEIKLKLKLKLFLIFILLFYIFSYIFAFSHIDNLKGGIVNSAANSLFENAAADSLTASAEFINEITADEEGFYLKSEDLIKLKAAIIKSMQKGINKTETVFVPFGNFTGISILEGLLHPIPVRVSFMGSAKVTFSESFESCGVNQSIYCLKACIEAKLSPSSLKFQGQELSLNLYTEYILAERLIIGQVPSYYQDRG
ncbi:MAG: hypothetical protein E7564_02010 [Ruminococcaceae bacterium]|nr:hypothetical protein [Oscillospiraceae bacterium]